VALLSLEHVTRRFGGVVAVDDVSLAVESGQIAGLIGPNGAGKTTLFNLITRLYRPDSGEIAFGGKSLLGTPPHRIVRRGIARTFQNVELFPTMTVLENVLVGSHVRGERPARDLLAELGLTPVAQRRAAGLPFGTMKRVELARALASGPRLLLLDEPAGGLSHEEVEELGTLIRRIRQMGGASRLPAIALTAYARKQDADAAIASGYDRHLPKPVDPAVLAATVANLVPSAARRPAAE